MAGIFAGGKIRIGMLCFNTFLFCSIPSYGESPQELNNSSDTVVVSPAIKSPTEKTPAKGELPHQIYAGTKQSHSQPANGKIPPEPKDSILKHKNPIDMSTGKELLPMPVESTH